MISDILYVMFQTKLANRIYRLLHLLKDELDRRGIPYEVQDSDESLYMRVGSAPMHTFVNFYCAVLASLDIVRQFDIEKFTWSKIGKFVEILFDNYVIQVDCEVFARMGDPRVFITYKQLTGKSAPMMSFQLESLRCIDVGRGIVSRYYYTCLPYKKLIRLVRKTFSTKIAMLIHTFRRRFLSAVKIMKELDRVYSYIAAQEKSFTEALMKKLDEKEKIIQTRTEQLCNILQAAGYGDLAERMRTIPLSLPILQFVISNLFILENVRYITYVLTEGDFQEYINYIVFKFRDVEEEVVVLYPLDLMLRIESLGKILGLAGVVRDEYIIFVNSRGEVVKVFRVVSERNNIYDAVLVARKTSEKLVDDRARYLAAQACRFIRDFLLDLASGDKLAERYVEAFLNMVST